MEMNVLMKLSFAFLAFAETLNWNCDGNRDGNDKDCLK